MGLSVELVVDVVVYRLGRNFWLCDTRIRGSFVGIFNALHPVETFPICMLAGGAAIAYLYSWLVWVTDNVLYARVPDGIEAQSWSLSRHNRQNCSFQCSDVLATSDHFQIFANLSKISERKNSFDICMALDVHVVAEAEA